MIGGTSAYSSQFSSTSTSTKVTATGSSSQICSANVHRLGGEGERGSGSGSRGGSESALESGMRTRSNLITSTQDTFSSSTAGNAAISRMIQLQPARGLDVHHSQRYLLPQNNSNSNNDSNNDNDDARQQLQLEVTTDAASGVAASGVAASGVLRERGSQHSTTDFQSNLKKPNSTYDFTLTEVATTDTEKDDYKEVEKERRISNIPVSVSVPNLSENIIFISDPICLDEESSDLRVHAEALMDDDKEKSDMMDVVIENENQEENENEIRMMKIVEMETENVHFEYISRKVLQQLDDVMSTAAQFDSSAPIERMNMMRDGLVLLLQRDQIESYEEGKMTGSRTREKSSEMDLINSQERMRYDGRVPSTTASTDKKVGDVTNIKRVSDINDTMQLLMTIIANAKVGA